MIRCGFSSGKVWVQFCTFLVRGVNSYTVPPNLTKIRESHGFDPELKASRKA